MVVPDADFSAASTGGPRPLSVQFNNLTTGTVTDWLWDFGDGTTSIEREPVHLYADAGTYDVTLTATGPVGVDSLTRPGFIQVTSPLADASFEMQAAGSAPGAPWTTFFGVSGNAGIMVRSIAGGGDLGLPSDGQLWCEIGAESTQSTLPPMGGTGTTALTGAGISQEFTYPAGMSVLQFEALFINAEGFNQPLHNDWMRINVSNGVRTEVIYRRDTLSATENVSTLHAGQIATPLEVVTADLLKLFPDSSHTTLFTLTIQVGNGGDGDNPSHGYVDNLRFETPAPALIAEFQGAPTSVEVGLPVNFTDLSTGNPTSWSWDFGDGFASSMQNPSHVYTIPGLYDVILRAVAPGTSDLVIERDLIMVFAPGGVVDFDATPLPAPTGQDVTFVNLSNGNFVDWTWDFGDGQMFVQTSLATPVLHPYTAAGTYNVSLTGRFQNNSTVVEMKTGFVNVQDLPSISVSPQSQQVVVGETASFNAVATGSDLHFEWRLSGVPITGAPDQPGYTTPPTVGDDNGDQYSVRVFNGVGSDTSASATLTVVTPPVITQQPQSTAVILGQTATFSVAASSLTPLSFQWRKNGADIPGATASSHTTPPAVAGDNGAVFSVIVSNNAGETSSQNATLTVTEAPVITMQPQNVQVAAPSTATFTVVATGTPPLSFQWRKNGANIPGATASSHTTPPTSSGDNGAQFSVVVSNGSGMVNSNNAILTVVSAPTITQHPQSQTFLAGNNVTFTAAATGTGVQFEWQRNDGAWMVVGQNSTSFSLVPATCDDDNTLYRVRVFNAAGSVFSNVATLTAAPTPTFTTVYASLSSCIGCHSGGSPAGSLSLATKATAYSELVGTAPNFVDAISCSPRKLVLPGDPNNSVFYLRVTNMCGGPMPPNGSLLTQNQLDNIAAWIRACAQDN